MLFPLWATPTNAPSKTAERFLSPEGVMGWSTSNITGRFPVPPGGGTLRNFIVILAKAPGLGKSWTLSYAINGVENVLTRIKIEGEAKTGEWKGELKLKEKDTFQILLVPSGEPEVPGVGEEGTAMYTWVETAGNTFWIAGGGSNNSLTGEPSYNPPYGINSAGWQATEGLNRIIVPGKFKLKGVAFDLSGTAGSGKSYTLYARVNRSEDTMAVKIEGTTDTFKVAEGSVQLKAGETLETKLVPSGTPTARSVRYCYVVESEAHGEMFAGGTVETVESATAKRFSWSDTWKSGWSAVSAYLPRPSGLKFERFYIEIGTAPGAGKSRIYEFLKFSGVATGLKVEIEGSSTSGNDAVHSFVTDGGRVEMSSTPSGSPAENTGGSHWGFVVIVPQIVYGAANTSGTSTAQLDGRRRRLSGANPTGNSFASDAGVRRRFSAGSTSGLSGVVSVGMRRRHSAASVSGGSFASDTGIRRRYGGGTFSSVGDTMATGARRRYGGGEASGSSFMSDVGVRRRFGAGAASASSGVDATGSRRSFGAAVVSGLGTAVMRLKRIFTTVPGKARLSDASLTSAALGDSGVGSARIENHPVLLEEE